MARRQAPSPLSADGAPADPAPADRSRPPWSVVALALALAVLGLVTAVVVSLRGSGDGLGKDQQSALDAARERSVALTSYGFTTLDADFARVLSTATDPFKKTYADTTAKLRATFVQQQAVAKGTVVAAGLERASGDSAVAIVAVDQVVDTTSRKGQKVGSRLRMTLVRRGGTWFVERVDQLL